MSLLASHEQRRVASSEGVGKASTCSLDGTERPRECSPNRSGTSLEINVGKREGHLGSCPPLSYKFAAILLTGAEGGIRNPHAPCGHYVLNVARLPFRHFGTFAWTRNPVRPGWWATEESNLGPLACEASALTTELAAHENTRCLPRPRSSKGHVVKAA